MNTDLGRYSRQMVLPQIGREGQEKLLRARVAVVGLGALGSVSSSLLSRAGVGHLTIIDRDVVELDNLQRQLLFEEGDIGEAKALVAEKRLAAMNSQVEISPRPVDLRPGNIGDILDGVDVVVDGLDNLTTRFVVNDHCVRTGTPFIYGGAVATYGMTMTIVPMVTACFECLFPSLPPAGTVATCETDGVLNTVPTTVSSLQVADAIRLIMGDDVGGELMTYDAWTREFSGIRISRNEDCPSCGKKEFRHLVEDDADLAVSLCGRNSVSIRSRADKAVDFDSLESRLAKVGKTRRGERILMLEVEGYKMTIFDDGRVLISGTGDVAKARSLYSRFIGD